MFIMIYASCYFLLIKLLQVFEAIKNEFDISEVEITPWKCNYELELFSSEGIIKLEIPSQIAAYMSKISYSVSTSVEGMTSSAAHLCGMYKNVFVTQL